MIKAGFSVFQTSITLPYIGKTTPLNIMIFLALLGYLCSFVNRLLGGDGDGDDE